MSPTLSSHQRLLYTLICLSSLSSPSFGQYLDSKETKKLQEGIRLMKEKNYDSAQKVFIGLVQDYEENLPPNMSETPRWLLSVAYRKAGKIEKELGVYRDLANLYVKEWLDLDTPPPTSKLQNKTVGDLFYNMSTIYCRKGEYPHAKHCGRLAMTIYGNTKDKIMKASAEGLIGEILHRQANLKGNAQEAHQNRIQSMVYTASACRNFRKANAKKSMESNKNYKTAFDTLKHLVEALSKNIPKKPKSKEEITDRGLLAKAYVELGQSSYALSNNKQQAGPFYKEAFKLYKYANLPFHDWKLLSDLCRVLGSLNNAYLVFSTLPKDSKPSYDLYKYGVFWAKKMKEKMKEKKKRTKERNINIYEVTLNPFWHAEASLLKEIFSAEKTLSSGLIDMHKSLAKLYMKQKRPKYSKRCHAEQDYIEGICAHDTKKFKEAEQLSLKAANTFQKLGDHVSRAKCLQLLRSAYRDQGERVKATRVTLDLASLYCENKKYEEANNELISATNILKERPLTTQNVNTILDTKLLESLDDLSVNNSLKWKNETDENSPKDVQYADKKAYMPKKTGNKTQEIAFACTRNNLGGCYYKIGVLLQHTIAPSSEASQPTDQVSSQCDIYLQKAQKCYKEALEIRKEWLPNSPDLVKSYFNLGCYFCGTRKNNLAIQHFLSGIAIYDHIKKSKPEDKSKLEDYLYIRTGLIYVYEDAGQLDNALRQAQKVWKSIENPTLRHIELCEAHIRIYERKLAIEKRNPSTQANRKQPAANHAYIKEITNWYEKILNMNKKAKNEIGIITSHRKLGIFFFEYDMTEKALNTFQRASELVSKVSTTHDSVIPLRADIAYNLGKTLYTLRKFKEASDALLSACSLYKKSPDYQETDVRVTECHIALANSYLALGKYVLAINYNKEAARGLRSQPTQGRACDLKLAQLNYDIGLAYNRLYRKGDASMHSLQYYEKARVLQEKHFDTTNISDLELKKYLENPDNIDGLKMLILIYTSMGKNFLKAGESATIGNKYEYGRAESYYGSAKKLNDKIFKFAPEGTVTDQDRERALDTYLGIAKAEEKLDKDTSDIVGVYTVSIKLARLIYGNNHPKVARIYNDLASFLHKKNTKQDLMQCLKNYQKAHFLLSQSSPQSLDMDYALLGIGMTHKEIALKFLKDEDKKENHLKMSIKYLKKTLALREKIYDKKDIRIANVLVPLADNYVATKQLKEATKAYQRAINIAKALENDPVASAQALKIRKACKQQLINLIGPKFLSSKK